MTLLKSEQIKKEIGALKGWEISGESIRKTYTFRDFVRAVGFVSSVALLAEKANHHPDIDIRWNRVILALETHSERGLTEKDFKLAREIDAL